MTPMTRGFWTVASFILIIGCALLVSSIVENAGAPHWAALCAGLYVSVELMNHRDRGGPS